MSDLLLAGLLVSLFFPLWGIALYLARTLVATRTGAGDLLPWHDLSEDEATLRFRDGRIARVFELRGLDVPSTSEDRLTALVDQVAATLAAYSERWDFQFDQVHVPRPSQVAARRPGFERFLAERDRFFARAPAIATRTYLTLVYRPPAEGEEPLAEFARDAAAAATRLRELELEPVTGEALRDFLSLLLTARPGPLAPLPLRRGPLRYGSTPIRILHLTGYPRTLQLGLADLAAHATFPIRLTLQLTPLARTRVATLLDLRRRSWARQRFTAGTLFSRTLTSARAGEEDPEERTYVRRVHQVLQAEQEKLDAGEERFYDLQHLVALYGAPEGDVGEVGATLLRRGISFYEDAETADLSFLESLPGAPRLRLTTNLFPGRAAARLVPLTSQWTGSPAVDCELYPEGSPALLDAFVSGTPLRFSYSPFVRGCGHHLLFGPTGTGKSTLLAAECLAHLATYENARVIYVDYGGSIRGLATALGGAYHDLRAPEAATLNPFRGLREDAQLYSVGIWLEKTFEIAEPDVPVTAEIRERLHAALRALSDEESDHWNLSTFLQLLQDRHVKHVLATYCSDGPLGELLDPPADAADLPLSEDLTVFEIEQLLELPERLSLPVLIAAMSLILRATRDRRPTLLLIDEARVLRHPVLRAALSEWMATFRKRNVALALSTQSPYQFEEPDYLAFLAAQAPTRVYAPDPSALANAAAYAPLGLAEDELRLISRAVPRADYYVTSSAGRALVNFAFTGVFLDAITGNLERKPS
jgi:type IV secretion system protein VirB4